MTPKAIQNGNPRCWHCLNRLVYQKGGGFKFRLVRDPLGNEHRVHLDCLDKVLGDGIVEVKPWTPLNNGQTPADLEALEREHFGDADRGTGIYAEAA